MAQEEIKKVAEKVVDPKREAKKVAKKELRSKQREAFEKLSAVCEKSADAEVKKAFLAFTSLKAVRTGGGHEGNPAYARFVAFVQEKGSVTEDLVFKQFKVGRKDCAGFLRKALKNAEPKNRIWINFTPSDGVYKMLGTGVKAPEGYTGYVPTDDITDLKAPNLK